MTVREKLPSNDPSRGSRWGDGLVAYYPLDSPGSTLYDRSGHGHHCSAADAQLVPDMLGALGNSTGGAVSLEGHASFISCPWTVTKNLASPTIDDRPAGRRRLGGIGRQRKQRKLRADDNGAAGNAGAEGYDDARNFTICLYAKTPNSSGVALWSIGSVYDTVERNAQDSVPLTTFLVSDGHECGSQEKDLGSYRSLDDCATAVYWDPDCDSTFQFAERGDAVSTNNTNKTTGGAQVDDLSCRCCSVVKGGNADASWNVYLIAPAGNLSESTDQQWHHYCLVSDGRTNGDALLYMDGVYRGADFKRIKKIQEKHALFEIGRYWPQGRVNKIPQSRLPVRADPTVSCPADGSERIGTVFGIIFAVLWTVGCCGLFAVPAICQSMTEGSSTLSAVAVAACCAVAIGFSMTVVGSIALVECDEWRHIVTAPSYLGGQVWFVNAY